MFLGLRIEMWDRGAWRFYRDNSSTEEFRGIVAEISYRRFRLVRLSGIVVDVRRP